MLVVNVIKKNTCSEGLIPQPEHIKLIFRFSLMLDLTSLL